MTILFNVDLKTRVLKEYGPYVLRCLNNWSSLGGTVWEELGNLVFLKEM